MNYDNASTIFNASDIKPETFDTPTDKLSQAQLEGERDFYEKRLAAGTLTVKDSVRLVAVREMLAKLAFLKSKEPITLREYNKLGK